MERLPIVRGSMEKWWDALTDEERTKYGGEINKDKKWVELNQALRNSLSILTLDLKGGNHE